MTGPTVEISAEEYAELQRAREKAAARRENAIRSAGMRSNRVRDGIRSAIRQLPANSREIGHARLARDVRAWVERKGPESFNLDNVPDVRIIKSVIEQMASNPQQDAASCTKTPACWWHPINPDHS